MRRNIFRRDAGGSPYDPQGSPNDDPIFKVLEQIEEERHQEPSPPPPQFG